jgi:hypothetical protein
MNRHGLVPLTGRLSTPRPELWTSDRVRGASPVSGKGAEFR